MSLTEITNYLQSRSPQTKNRIIALVTMVAVIGLGSIWVKNIPNQLSGLDSDDLLPGEVAGSALSTENRVAIETMENRDGKTYLNFKVTNNSSDILNFSPADKISLEANGSKHNIENILDRQQGPFVKKILSNSTAYGVLVLPEDKFDQATLTFDQMYFEQSPNNLFREILEVDLDKLKPIGELRS